MRISFNSAYQPSSLSILFFCLKEELTQVTCVYNVKNMAPLMSYVMLCWQRFGLLLVFLKSHS